MAEVKIPLADKPTLDVVNVNLGKPTEAPSETGQTGFSLWKWMAQKLGGVDARIGTEADTAGASTIFSILKQINNEAQKSAVSSFSREVSDFETAPLGTMVEAKKARIVSGTPFDNNRLDLSIPSATNAQTTAFSLTDCITGEIVQSVTTGGGNNSTTGGPLIVAGNRLISLPNGGRTDTSPSHARKTTAAYISFTYNPTTKRIVTSGNWTQTNEPASTFPSSSGTAFEVCGILSPHDDNVYAYISGTWHRLNNSATGTPTWQALNATGTAPAMSSNSYGLLGVGSNIYVATGNQLRIYNITNNAWSTAAAPPGSIGGTLIHDNGYIYAITGTAMYRYRISNNTWTTLIANTGITHSSSGGRVIDGILFTSNAIYSLHNQVSIMPVTKGSQLQVNANCSVRSSTGVLLQNVPRNQITAVLSDGYLVVDSWLGGKDKITVSGWTQ